MTKPTLSVSNASTAKSLTLHTSSDLTKSLMPEYRAWVEKGDNL